VGGAAHMHGCKLVNLRLRGCRLVIYVAMSQVPLMSHCDSSNSVNEQQCPDHE